MRFQTLGPLRFWDGSAWRTVPATQPRAVLAVLVAEAGRPVSVDRLVNEVWGENPPRTARNTIQGYVARLRRMITIDANCPIVTLDRGYQLDLDADDLDSARFDRLVRSARGRLAEDAPAVAEAALARALALWRGPALADVPRTPAVAAEATRLDEARLAAIECRLGVQLDLGRHAEVVGELAALVEEHPLREDLWAGLMLALYRCGRRAEALAAYQRARRLFITELGLEPGPALRDLERSVLSGVPALAAPRPLADPAPQQSADSAPRSRAAADPAVPATTTASPAPASAVPAQLPAAVAGFAGREAPLAELDAILAGAGPAAANGAAALVVAAIVGTAGVGKTTLAVHWAHRVRDRFPDGQLYVDLRGFDPVGPPSPPDDVARDFLAALGVPPESIPAGLQPKAALYRTLLADRRMLVLLDNAHDADQVRPLLPGSADCLVLVTSRRQLSSLLAGGARQVTLDLMPDIEAASLLAHRVGPARMEREPAAAQQIIERCARLPLALTVAAARAAANPRLSLTSLAAELHDVHHGLDVLNGGDTATDVRAVFSWSYHHLNPDEAQMFRLLGLHPGPDVTVPGAASLAGVTQPQARSALSTLARAHLTHEHRSGRYATHDLLRRYASELSHALDDESARGAAIRRFTNHYVRVASTAAILVGPGNRAAAVNGDTGAGTPRTAEQAMRWYDAERSTLLATIRRAAAEGFDDSVCDLAHALTELFDRRGHWRDWADIASLAQVAAERLGEPGTLARLHRSRGRAEVWLGNPDAAQRHLDRALTLYAEIGDQAGLAHTYRTLAWCLGRQGAHRAAVAHARTAVDLHAAAGDRAGQGLSLNALGWQHAHLDEYAQALHHCREAVAILDSVGDSNGAGYAHDSVGYIYHRLGDHTAAAQHYRRAAALLRETGDVYQEGDTLMRLGDACKAAQDHDGAEWAWRRAVDLLTPLHHPHAEQARTRLGGR